MTSHDINKISYKMMLPNKKNIRNLFPKGEFNKKKATGVNWAHHLSNCHF